VRARSSASSAVVLGGCLGLTAFVAGLLGATHVLPAWAAWLLAAAPVLPLVAATLDSAGAAAGADPALLARLDAGARVAWPALVAIAALPLTRCVPGWIGGHLPALFFASAFALLAWRWPVATEGEASPRARSRDPWCWASLALVGSVSVLYLVIGVRAGGSPLFDGHYYFGVARHIAQTGRLEEPIVWHFLTPPASLVHPPFDYWGGLTSLVLVPVLWLTGGSYDAALVAMTLVSVLSLLGFWYLVNVASPLRHPLARLITLLVFCFSPAVRSVRFDTETIALTHLSLVLSLIAFARGRWAQAAAWSFLVGLTRTAGMFCWVIVVVAAALRIVGEPRERRVASLGRVALVVVALASLFVGNNLFQFGTLTPPGSARVLQLASAKELLVYHAPGEGSSPAPPGAVRPERLLAGLGRALRALRDEPLVPAETTWLVLAVLGSLLSGRPTVWLALALLATPFVTIPLQPTRPLADGSLVALSSREIMPLLPPVVFAGGAALDRIAGLLGAWRRDGRLARPKALASAAVAFAACWIFVGPLDPYGDRPRASMDLAPLEEALRGEPVATFLPYNVIAYTHSPAVSIPINGEAAIEAVLRRYGVRWLLLTPRPVPHWMFQGEPSDRPLVEIYHGRRRSIGSLGLIYAGEFEPLRLFRVVYADPPPQARF